MNMFDVKTGIVTYLWENSEKYRTKNVQTFDIIFVEILSIILAFCKS